MAVEDAEDVGGGEVGGAQGCFLALAGHLRGDDDIAQVEQEVVGRGWLHFQHVQVGVILRGRAALLTLAAVAFEHRQLAYLDVG